MLHIEQKEIEHYLLNGIRDKERIEQIKDHLRTCRECETYYKQIKDLYASIKSMPGASFRMTHSIVHRRTGGPFKSRPIFLHPVSPNRNCNGLYLLSAETAAPMAFEHVQSYLSDDHNMLARMLYDSQKEDLNLFLITDQITEVKDTMIRFESLNVCYFMDAKGSVRLEKSLKPDIIDSGIAVWPLKIRFDSREIEPLKEIHRSVPRVVLQNREGDRLVCEMSNMGRRTSWIFRMEEEAAYAVHTMVVRLKDPNPAICSDAESGVFRFFDLDAGKIKSLQIH